MTIHPDDLYAMSATVQELADEQTEHLRHIETIDDYTDEDHLIIEATTHLELAASKLRCAAAAVAAQQAKEVNA